MRCAIGWHAWGHQYDKGLLEAWEFTPGASAVAYYPFWVRVCAQCGRTQGRANDEWPCLPVVHPKEKPLDLGRQGKPYCRFT